MATKDFDVPFKGKQNVFVDTGSNGQYNNLNLNKSNQLSTKDSVCSKSITSYNTKSASYGKVNWLQSFLKHFLKISIISG